LIALLDGLDTLDTLLCFLNTLLIYYLFVLAIACDFLGKAGIAALDAGSSSVREWKANGLFWRFSIL